MSPATVIITVAAYFALLLTVGWLTSRRSDNAAFFNGGRRAPWLLVAFAMIGSAISGVTFISVPGMVAAKGHSYLQMVLGFIAGYAIISMVLVPAFYRRNLISIYGYLDERFGNFSYRSGAWVFFISKMLGASVRFFVVCAVLQTLVFAPLGIPFAVNVAVTIALIWLYTMRGGVRTLIWTDLLKSFCLIASVTLCIIFIASAIGVPLTRLPQAVAAEPHSRVFYFDDPMSGLYFWKQFIAGIFMAIATNGLDQDMMQRNMACRDQRAAAKNMLLSGVLQFFVVGLFLVLGSVLLLYVSHTGMTMPAKSDELFGMIATSGAMPAVVGILFVVGLISAAYSAAGSALTSLTTSFTVDILDGTTRYADAKLAAVRKRVHLAMSAIMGLVIILFWYLSEDDAISAVYALASYTYGPILGLFAFGLFTRRQVRDSTVPAICICAPALSWAIQWALQKWLGYTTGFELLLLNAALTFIGLGLSSLRQTTSSSPEYVEEPA